MSLRIFGSFRLTQRVAIATALAASLGLTTLAAADEQVTALLRNGERVTGRFDGFNNGQVYVDVSDTDERKIPVGDVVLLDFVGGAQGLPETELSQARGDDHVLLLKSRATRPRVGSCPSKATDRNPHRPLSLPHELGRGAARPLLRGRPPLPGPLPGRGARRHVSGGAPDHRHHRRPDRRGDRQRQPALDSDRHHRRQGAAGALRRLRRGAAQHGRQRHGGDRRLEDRPAPVGRAAAGPAGGRADRPCR